MYPSQHPSRGREGLRIAFFAALLADRAIEEGGGGQLQRGAAPPGVQRPSLAPAPTKLACLALLESGRAVAEAVYPLSWRESRGAVSW